MNFAEIDNFESYLDQHPEVVKECVKRVKLVSVNQATLDLFEAKDQGSLLLGLHQIFQEESYGTFKKELIAMHQGQTLLEFEMIVSTLEGHKLHAIVGWTVPPGHEKTFSKVFVSVVDITQRKNYEEQTKTSLKEKDLLLREIQHRTKNNLQVISSMLSLQLLNIKDENHKSMFQDALTRVKTMAITHDTIYQSDNVANIDIGEYIQTIVKDVFRTYEQPKKRVSLKIDCCQCYLNIDKNMSLGLIVNELVSNSLKHGFPENNEGEIQITLRSVGENKYEFVFKDNGVGLPKDFDLQNTNTVGMVLVKALAEDNLQGQLEINYGVGVEFKITFSE